MSERRSRVLTFIFVIVIALTAINLVLGYRTSKNIDQSPWGDVSQYEAPKVVLKYPQAGDTVSGIIKIRWRIYNMDEDNLICRVSYSTDGGNIWIKITQTTTGLPSKSSDDEWMYWDTTEVPDGSMYLIQVTCNDGLEERSDSTDGYFTIDNSSTYIPDDSSDNIPPKVVIEAPDGDSEERRKIRIKWYGYDADGDALTYNVSYSPDGGETWISLATGLRNESGGSILTYWDSLTVPDGSMYVIRVTYSDGFGIGTEFTDGFISIENFDNDPPRVFLEKPQPGDTVSGLYQIKWRGRDNDGDALTHDVSYSPDGGETWILLATGLPNAPHTDWMNWGWDTTTTPNGSMYLIRVTCSDGVDENSDTINDFFTIDNPETEITTSEPLETETTTSEPLETETTTSEPLETETTTSEPISKQETKPTSSIDVQLVEWHISSLDEKIHFKLNTTLNGTEVPPIEILVGVKVNIRVYEDYAKLDNKFTDTYILDIKDWILPTSRNLEANIVAYDRFGNEHIISKTFTFIHWRTVVSFITFTLILAIYIRKNFLKV